MTSEAVWGVSCVEVTLTLHHGVQRSWSGLSVQLSLPEDGLQLGRADLKDAGSHLLIALAGHAGYHARGDTLLVPGNVLRSLSQYLTSDSHTYHVQYPLLGLVINVI